MARVVGAPERSVARLSPAPEGGRVTRSQTRAGTAELVAPLERDRPRRAPARSHQRAKTWWTNLVRSAWIGHLHDNDCGCVVNTIPCGLRDKWIEVITFTHKWMAD